VGDGADAALPTAAAGTGASAAGGAAPLEKLRASYSGTGTIMAPWWLALEGGYFREQGLDAELALIPAGTTLLAALRNGEVDLAGTGGSTFVLGYLEGLETLVIGANVKILDSNVLVRPEIQTVDDLRGKTIGVNRLKASTDVAARLAFQRLGLQPDVDVFTRGTGGQAESLAALQAGTVDGVAFGVPALFEARRLGYRELVRVGDYRLAYADGVIGATRGFLDRQPDRAERALRALAQAVSRFETDREFASQVLGKYGQVDDRAVLDASVEYYRPLFALDPYPDREAMQAVLDVEEHPAARTTRPDDVADGRFAERLRSSGFLDQLPR
jgi:NitT/TauT family transport system substrate-binding protein